MRTDEETRIAESLQGAVEAHGLIVDDLRVQVAGSRRLVQLTVDVADEESTEPVSLDLIAQASRAVSAALDEKEPFDGRAYTLEVSSRGTTRPLTEPRHWKRNVGRLIAVRTDEGEKFVGRLAEVGTDGPVLMVDGERRTLAYERLRSAKVEVEFK